MRSKNTERKRTNAAMHCLGSGLKFRPLLDVHTGIDIPDFPEAATVRREPGLYDRNRRVTLTSNSFSSSSSLACKSRLNSAIVRVRMWFVARGKGWWPGRALDTRGVSLRSGGSGQRLVT